MNYIFPILIILACFFVTSHFRKKAIKRRVDLKMIFFCKNNCRLNSGLFLDMSCTSTLLLYKKNLYIRNKAVLQYWERNGGIKEFYKTNDDDELFEIEKKCNTLGISYVSLKSKGSVIFIAVGPINKKRSDILTKNINLID